MIFKFLRMFIVSLLILATPPAWAVGDQEQIGEQPPTDPVNVSAAVPAMAPNVSLAGKPWRLVELAGKSLPEEQDAPYLLFTDGGELMGFGGCNYFIGKYRIGEEGKIVISSMRATNQHCAELSPRETVLLTSLVMANTLQLADEQLSFAMNGGCLMKLTPAPEIAVDELIQQGKLLKVHKKRGHKSRSKKKRKIASKSRKPGKTAAPKTSEKAHPPAKVPQAH